MGLEPTTFCMARTLRHATAFAANRHGRMNCGIRFHANRPEMPATNAQG